MDNYGLRKTGISPFRLDKLKNHSIDDFRFVLQLIFNNFKIASWAMNNFDFNWLESRGFTFPRKLTDIQREAKDIIQKNNKKASYSLQNAWEFFRNKRKNSEDRWIRYLKERDYIVSHRAIDDAWHEAKILYFLIKNYRFPLDRYQQNKSIKKLVFYL